MAEETNQSTDNSFSGGNIDLSESVFAPLFELPGIDGQEDIFGNIGAPSGNSMSEDNSSMDGENMQGGSESVNLGPFNRLLDIEGVDGVEDVFGGLMGEGGGNPFGGGDSSEGAGGNPFGGGGMPSGGEDGESGPPADLDIGELPYGGNPFAGDNFWTIFNGGENPADGASGGGMPMGGGGDSSGGNPFAGGMPSFGGSGDDSSGGNPFAGGMPSFGGSGDDSSGGNPFGGGMPSFGGSGDDSSGGNPFGGGMPSFGGGGFGG